MSEPKITVMIADDQELFASSMKIVLERNGTGNIEVIGLAANGQDLLDMVRNQAPDVALVDVRMPVLDGVQTTKILHSEFPEVRIMILTTFDDDEYVHEALESGATGYLLKNITPDELIASVSAVAAGSIVISQSVGAKLITYTETTNGRDGFSADERVRIGYLRDAFPDLSKREAEVLFLISQNLDNQEIADRLFIAVQTVRNYTSFIYTKIGVADRLHAMQAVQRKINPE